MTIASEEQIADSSSAARPSSTDGRPLHILALCHEWPPVGGGAAAVTEALSRSFVQLGHRVTVLTMALDQNGTLVKESGLSVHAISCGRKRKEMASVAEGLRWASAATRHALTIHGSQPFDICHAHFIMPGGIIANRLKRKVGLPFVITPHGSDVPGYNPERMKLAHILARPWWRRICRAADCIVSPSHDLLRLLSKNASGIEAAVIPNGIDPNRFVPLSKRRNILLCSRLVERKGFAHVLEIFTEIDAPGWRLDIVGDGPLRSVLEKLAGRCRIPVTMHGWVSQDDPRLARLYGEAALFMLPSQRENFSIALLEAMSAGCAVITTAVSGNPEVVGDCAIQVPWNDRKSLAEAMLTYTCDFDACEALGVRARQRVEQYFQWTGLARQYIAIFRQARVAIRRDKA